MEYPPVRKERDRLKPLTSILAITNYGNFGNVLTPPAAEHPHPSTYPLVSSTGGIVRMKTVLAVVASLLLALSIGCSENRANTPDVKDQVSKSLDNAGYKDVKVD